MSLLSPDFTSKVKTILTGIPGVDKCCLDENWGEIKKQFEQFESAYGQKVSELILGLKLLKIINQYIPWEKTATAPELVDSLLNGFVKRVGDVIVDPRSGQKSEVIERTISRNYGVLFTMRRQNGETYAWEFFD